MVVALAVSLTIVGCTTEDRPAAPEHVVMQDTVEPRYTQSAELEAALQNGDVGYDAYLAGFQRYSACLAAAGHTILMRGEESGQPLLQYSIPGSAVDSGADEECYHREFEPLDTAWQIANEDSSLWAETARECLRARGYEPAETLAEMNDQLAAAGIEHLECLRDG